MVECGQGLGRSIATAQGLRVGTNGVTVPGPSGPFGGLAPARSGVQNPTHMHFLNGILAVTGFAFTWDIL